MEWSESGENGDKCWPVSKSGRPMRSFLSFEKEVKEYLSNKINELVSALQLAHSKIITYHSEVSLIHLYLSVLNSMKTSTMY